MAQAQLPGKIFLSFPSTTVALPAVEGEQVVYEVELSSLNNEDISAIESCAITYGTEDENINEENAPKHAEKDPDYDQSMATSYQCTQRRNLKKTGRKKKEGDDLKCDICGKQYTKLKQLTTHKKYHSDKRPYICSVVGCGMAFKMANGLSRHMRTHTKIKPYKCSQCDMCFSQSGARKLHERRHNGERPYKCQICGDAFVQSSSLSYHMIKHSEDRKFQCEDCGSTFKHKKACERHKKLHKAREFQCEFCFREYCEKYEWQRHLKICKFRDNPLQKPAVIDLYKKENEHALKAELSTVDDKNDEVDDKVIETLIKPHLCSICGKQFLSAHYLKQHMRCHEEKAALGNLCDYCGKMFRSKISLVAHIRTHTGESPYECSICKQTFSTVGILNNHFRNHFDDRPFMCKLCHSSFKKKDAVMRHMHIHLNDSPNNCEFCNKPSSDKRTKVVHYRVHFERLFQKADVDKPRSTNADNYIQVLYHVLKKNKVIKSSEINNDNNMNPFYVYNDTDFAEIEKIFKEIVDVLGMEKKLFNNPIAMKDLHKIGVIEKDAYIEKPIIQSKQKEMKSENKMKKDQIAETKTECSKTESNNAKSTDNSVETNTRDNNTNDIVNNTDEQHIDTDYVMENDEKITNSLRRSTRKRKPKAMFDNMDSKKKVTLFSLFTKRQFSVGHEGENETKSTYSEIKTDSSDDAFMNVKNRTDKGGNLAMEMPCKDFAGGVIEDEVDHVEDDLMVYGDGSSLQERSVQDKSATNVQETSATPSENTDNSLGDMYIQEAKICHSNDLEGQLKQKSNDLEDHLEKESLMFTQDKDGRTGLEDPITNYNSDEVGIGIQGETSSPTDTYSRDKSEHKQTKTLIFCEKDPSKEEDKGENLSNSVQGGDNHFHHLTGQEDDKSGHPGKSCSNKEGISSVEVNSPLESDIQRESGKVDREFSVKSLESDIQRESEMVDREFSVKSEEILPDNKPVIGMKVVKINLSKISNGHGIAKSFYCSECGKGFYLKRLLDQHESACDGSEKMQKRQNTEQVYPCHMCDKEFVSNGSRRRHMTVHNDVLPYECNICHKRFSQKITRKLHVERIHGSEQLHACPICKKRFKILEDMQRHQMIHKGRERYKCEFCTDRSYYRREEYNTHVSRKHPIERPFRCGGCMKGFLTTREVKFHTRTTSCRAAIPKVLKLTVVDHDDVNE